MKKYIGLLVLAFLVSCKAKKAVVSETTATESLSADKVINGHYNSKRDFKTLYIKASIGYKGPKASQNVNAEIRIQKDQKILISIRVLGITMAKGLITPTEVKYYEKINGTFFEGDYTSLSKWLGTDLDFNKVQNMLIGQAIDDLHKGKYKTSIENELYKLHDTSNKDTEKEFFFEGSKFLVKEEEITQKSKNRMLHVSYPNYKEYPEMVLPTEIQIEAFEKENKTSIRIEYNTATFNEEMSFPYSAPEGYERTFIN